MNKQQPKTNTSLDKYPGSEMTVKAMIRKEAIECIRGFMGQLTKGCQEAIMTAIPELHKSEDETHRKWILEYLYDGLQKADEQFKDHFKSAINWLEKQKEQKPIFKKGDKVIWDDEEFNILDVNETEYNVGGYRVPFSRQNELHPIWQKSAEWSEEDKTHLCWIIECFDSWKYQVPEFADQYQSAIDWLKSLRPDSYKNCNSRWKPSEEQMDWLESAVKLSIDKPHIHGIIISLYEQLKRL